MSPFPNEADSAEVIQLRRDLREEKRQTSLFTESLIPLGLALLRETDLAALLEKILREAQRLSGADGATLYMRKENELGFFMVLNCSLKIELGGRTSIDFPPLPLFDEQGEPNLSNAACFSLLRGEVVKIDNIRDDRRFDFSGSRRFDEAHHYRTASLLTVPLAGPDGEGVAVLQLVNAIDPDTGDCVPFSPAIQLIVEALAALAAGALESFVVRDALYQQQQLYLHHLETTQARLRSELDEAEKYVRAILPPFQHEPLKIDWLLASCSELGGDSLGYHEIDPDHWAFYVLDVCGHGVSAALLSVTALNVLRGAALPGVDFRDPGGVLTALNRAFLMRNQNNMYFTIWYGVLQLSTRELRYASAGHAPAVLVDRTGHTTQKLTLPGLVLGAREGKVYVTQSTILPAGAVLYIISDGTYELRLADGTLWPFAAFIELITSLSADDPAALQLLHSMIVAKRAPERLEDDFTVVRVRT